MARSFLDDITLPFEVIENASEIANAISVSGASHVIISKLLLLRKRFGTSERIYF